MAAKRKSKSRKTPQSSVCDCNSPLVGKRLSRIEANYELLDTMLTELEALVPEPAPVIEDDALPNKPR